MSARAVANVYEPAQPRQPSSAPRETRTPTRDTPDKALNLARLPIPPQARDGADYRGGGRVRCGALQSSDGPATVTNTCSLQPFRTTETGGPDGRVEPHQAPARDLRLHQAVLVEARLPAHRARHREGNRADLLVDRARASREPREARAG